MKGPRQVVETRNPARQRDSTRPYDPMEHPEKQPRQKRYTPPYKAYQEVRITRKVGVQKEQEVIAWINKRIGDFKGKAEQNRNIPRMLFERSADARRFADALDSKFNILKGHLEIKARRNTR